MSGKIEFCTSELDQRVGSKSLGRDLDRVTPYNSLTSESLLHPALAQLLRYQASARLQRICRGFSTPRRLVLSCLGVLLALVWLSNAVLAIFLREPAEPATLRSIIPLGLLVYSLWHIVRVAYRRPEEAVDWTPAERELLCGRPFERRDLLVYRIGPIVTSAALKATCFSLLMLPDLRMPAIGFVGALLALLFVDLVRMAVEMVACGVGRQTYHRLRIVVLAMLSFVSVCVLADTLRSPMALEAGKSPGSLGLLMHVLESAMQLRETWIGTILELPFHVFGNVITAQQYSVGLAGWMVLALAMVSGSSWFVMWLDSHFLRAVVRRERLEYQRIESADGPARATNAVPTSVPRVPWAAGIGPIGWRQSIGAYGHLGGVFVALAAPSVFACLPLIVFDNPNMVLLNVVGSLAFYSFLLLPAALKFDFRRDVDRIAMLKSLPIRPAAVVTGQLAAPVLIVSAYQLAVLLITELIYPVHPGLLVAAIVLLAPLNILIFALDNLIYLLYPYRLNQEGLEILLRTTLTFTAKGLLFGLALGVMIGWALVAAQTARTFAGSSSVLGDAKLIFVVGAWLMLCLSAVVTWWLLVRAYCRFDPSQDTPA